MRFRAAAYLVVLCFSLSEAKISLALLGFKSEGASLQKQFANELFRLLDAEKNMDVYPLLRIDSLFSKYQMESQEMARFQLPFLLKNLPAHIYVYGKLAPQKIQLKRYWWFPWWGDARVKQKLHLTVLDGIRGEYRYIGAVEGWGKVGRIYMGVNLAKDIFLDPMVKHLATSEAVRDVAESTARVIVLTSRGVSRLSDSAVVSTSMSLPQVNLAKPIKPKPVEIDSTPVEKPPEEEKNSKLPVDQMGDATKQVKPEKISPKEEKKESSDPLPEEFLLLQEGMKW